MATTGKKVEVDTARLTEDFSKSNLAGTGEVIHHVARGEAPSNVAVQGALEDVKKMVGGANQGQLDPTGTKIVQDTQRVVESAQQWIGNKNQDESLQKLAMAGISKAPAAKEGLMEGTRATDRTPLQQEARRLLRSAATLSTELARSTTFRRSFMEFFSLAGLLLSDKGSVTQFLNRSLETDTGSSYGPIPETTYTNAESQRLSDEQVSALETRFFNMMRAISSRPASKKAANSFLGILNFATEFFNKQRMRQGSFLDSDPEAREMVMQARTLFERVAGGRSLQPLIDMSSNYYNTMSQDQAAVGHFKAMQSHFWRMLDNPDVMNDNNFITEGKQLLRNTRHLFWEHPNYGPMTRSLINEVREFGTSIQNDPQNVQLQQDVERLVKDIFIFEQGGTRVRPEAFSQLRLIVSSILRDQLRELPIPPVHFADEDADVRVSNIVLNVSDITPDHVRIKQKAKMGFSLLGAPSATQGSGKMKIILENMQTHLRKVHFDYKRFTFPRIEESGQADLDVGGQGMVITVVMMVDALDRLRPLKFIDNTVNIDRLRLRVEHTKRDFFYNLLIRLFSGTIKRRLERNLRKQMRGFFMQLNEMIGAATEKVALKAQQSQGPVAAVASALGVSGGGAGIAPSNMTSAAQHYQQTGYHEQSASAFPQPSNTLPVNAGYTDQTRLGTTTQYPGITASSATSKLEGPTSIAGQLGAHGAFDRSGTAVPAPIGTSAGYDVSGAAVSGSTGSGVVGKYDASGAAITSPTTGGFLSDRSGTSFAGPVPTSAVYDKSAYTESASAAGLASTFSHPISSTLPVTEVPRSTGTESIGYTSVQPKTPDVSQALPRSGVHAHEE